MRRLSVLVLSLAVLAAGGAAVLAARPHAGAASAGPATARLVNSVSSHRAGLPSAHRPRPKNRVNPRLPGPRTCFVAAGGQCGLRPCVEFLGSASGLTQPATTDGAIVHAPTVTRPNAKRGATRCRPAPGSYRVAGASSAGPTSSPVSLTARTATSALPAARTTQATRGAN